MRVRFVVRDIYGESKESDSDGRTNSVRFSLLSFLIIVPHMARERIPVARDRLSAPFAGNLGSVCIEKR